MSPAKGVDVSAQGAALDIVGRVWPDEGGVDDMHPSFES
jgi:hypothetical protein